MFGQIGMLASLLGNLPRIKQEIGRLQERLSKITAEGDAGGGMVKVRVNGRLEVIACRLSDEIMQLHDRELLEDLIRSATNLAMERVRQQVAEETSQMMKEFGLPAGMNIPGLDLPGLGS